MKGVSAVIAIILILMITVALAAMAYVWFTSVFQSLSGGAENATKQTTVTLGTSFSIESAVWVSSDGNVSVSLRNIGSQAIDISGVSMYLNNIPATITQWGAGNNGVILSPKEVTNSTHPFKVKNTTSGPVIVCGTTQLTVYGPTGYKASATVIC